MCYADCTLGMSANTAPEVTREVYSLMQCLYVASYSLTCRCTCLINLSELQHQLPTARSTDVSSIEATIYFQGSKLAIQLSSTVITYRVRWLPTSIL